MIPLREKQHFRTGSEARGGHIEGSILQGGGRADEEIGSKNEKCSFDNTVIISNW